jgi:hypothetical protein
MTVMAIVIQLIPLTLSAAIGIAFICFAHVLAAILA